MKFKRSELTIENLLVIGCNIITVPVTSESKFPLFDNIELSADFEILTNSQDKSKFKVLFSVSGNNLKVIKPGYSFSIAAEGIFRVNDIDNLPKEKFDNFLSFSALPILISHVRTYLMNTTAYYPYGKFILPAIDLRELITDKNNDLIKGDAKKKHKKAK